MSRNAFAPYGCCLCDSMTAMATRQPLLFLARWLAAAMQHQPAHQEEASFSGQFSQCIRSMVLFRSCRSVSDPLGQRVRLALCIVSRRQDAAGRRIGTFVTATAAL